MISDNKGHFLTWEYNRKIRFFTIDEYLMIHRVESVT
jgi:hypothetical protein